MEKEEAINLLLSSGYCGKKVAEAMRRVPREKFVAPSLSPFAYESRPLPIGFSQTISALNVVAFMLERLEIKSGMNILEIGTGSGYQTALLSILAGKKGKITTVELIPELVQLAKRNIGEVGLDSGNVTFITGDGTIGYEKNSPYDRIIATAAAPEIPLPLIQQLKPEGKLLIPVGIHEQELILFEKETGERKSIMPVLFVPLIGRHGFKV